MLSGASTTTLCRQWWRYRLHGLRGVAGFARRRGDHRDDSFSDETHRLDGERMPFRRCRARSVAAFEVGRIGKGPNAGADEIATGENALDSGHRDGGADVDARNPRVGMRRAYEADVELARCGQVVDEPPLAAQQRIILDALHRIAASEAARLPCSHR